MSATALPSPDAELLARYLREGCEASFAALVAVHERMVLGTALRRTGDAELARDVAQQVFALLARKAAWLTGRDSLAGWLHRAASFLGARAVRSEARARARHEALARETGDGPRDTESWTALDDSLAALSAGEREALVLHYFEDRSYPEMAATLGVSEAAARQRVSRGLRALGTRLRRRGIGASAAALLASGAALQSTMTVQAGLATAALSTGGLAAPAALLFSTIMSHTAAKLAVATLVLVALPVAYLRQEHARLLREHTASPAPAITLPVTTAGTARAAGRVADGAVLAAWEELRAAQTQRVQAEAKLAGLQREVERAETEVVVSYGQVEDLAHKLAAKARRFRELEPLQKSGNPEDRKRFAREMATYTNDIADLFVMAREAQKMESDPENVARFYATMLGEMAGLDAAAREPLLRVVRDRFAEMGRAGLVAAQRPIANDAGWMKSRRQALAGLDAALFAALPAERRSEVGSLANLFDFTGRDLFPSRNPGENPK